MKPSQVNGKPLNGVPETLFNRGMEKIKDREHLWLATVVFEMRDEDLAKGNILLDAEAVHAQNVQCIICGMPWKKGREGRICPGSQGG